MTERKVNAIGGRSYSITLPKEICKKIEVTEKTVFDIVEDQGKITLTRVK